MSQQFCAYVKRCACERLTTINGQFSFSSCVRQEYSLGSIYIKNVWKSQSLHLCCETRIELKATIQIIRERLRNSLVKHVFAETLPPFWSSHHFLHELVVWGQQIFENYLLRNMLQFQNFLMHCFTQFSVGILISILNNNVWFFGTKFVFWQKIRQKD